MERPSNFRLVNLVVIWFAVYLWLVFMFRPIGTILLVIAFLAMIVLMVHHLFGIWRI